eukprot:TRINITY_DN7789_c0_g1_i3.p1 TRINITY_DN7789_c0_g1~~TRINITY_DN7789_c0_g1_i3.p1  ORF type:complete len:355 (+),score=79.56 TRINITY_DN7789_c0_g1_i3:117-1181(+)
MKCDIMNSEAGMSKTPDTQEYNDEGFDPDFFREQFKNGSYGNLTFVPEEVEDVYGKNLVFELNSLSSNCLSTTAKRSKGTPSGQEFSFVDNAFDFQDKPKDRAENSIDTTNSEALLCSEISSAKRAPIRQKKLQVESIRDSLDLVTSRIPKVTPLKAIDEEDSSYRPNPKRPLHELPSFYDTAELTEKKAGVRSGLNSNLKAKVEEIRNAQRNRTYNEESKKVMPTPTRKANSTGLAAVRGVSREEEQRSKVDQHELIKSQVFPKHIEERNRMRKEILKETSITREYCANLRFKLKWVEEETDKYIKLGKEYEQVIKQSKEKLCDQTWKCLKLLEPITLMTNSFISEINPKDFY